MEHPLPEAYLRHCDWVEDITRPLTVAEALAPGVHAFGTPKTEKEAEEVAQNSLGDLTDGHLGSMDIDQLRFTHDKIYAALRARGGHSAGGITSIEDTMGGKEDHDKNAAQNTRRAKGEGAHDGLPVMTPQSPGGTPCVSEPLAQEETEDTAKRALQQHERIKQHPAAQASTSLPPLTPPPLVTLRSKARAKTPTSRDSMTQLAEEVDKHKLNLYHVNELSAKESRLTQTTLDEHKKDINVLKRMIQDLTTQKTAVTEQTQPNNYNINTPPSRNKQALAGGLAAVGAAAYGLSEDKEEGYNEESVARSPITTYLMQYRANGIELEGMDADIQVRIVICMQDVISLAN